VQRLHRWDGPVASQAAHLAMLAGAYVTGVRENYPPEELEAKRLVTRAMLAEFLLLDADMVEDTGTIRPDGMDHDIAAVCGVPSLQ
jgi:hypothetical protein